MEKGGFVYVGVLEGGRGCLYAPPPHTQSPPVRASPPPLSPRSASLAGRKRWLMYPPEQAALLFDKHGREGRGGRHAHIIMRVHVGLYIQLCYNVVGGAARVCQFVEM